MTNYKVPKKDLSSISKENVDSELLTNSKPHRTKTKKGAYPFIDTCKKVFEKILLYKIRVYYP